MVRRPYVGSLPPMVEGWVRGSAMLHQRRGLGSASPCRKQKEQRSNDILTDGLWIITMPITFYVRAPVLLDARTGGRKLPYIRTFGRLNCWFSRKAGLRGAQDPAVLMRRNGKKERGLDPT